MAKSTLKKLGIKKGVMMKHNYNWNVYSYKGKNYTSKEKAISVALETKTKKRVYRITNERGMESKTIPLIAAKNKKSALKKAKKKYSRVGKVIYKGWK